MAVQTQIQARRGTAATWTSTNPTLAAGEMGFETDTGKFKIGTGSAAWTALGYAGGGQNTLSTYVYTATSGQTTFSGADSNGNTLSYTVGAIQVYLNGALLTPTSDFTASTGTSVVLVTGALTSDTLTVLALGSFTVSTDIAKSTLSTKGDILTATAASTPAVLAVGSDGSSIVADSSTSSGLRWQGSIAAGKNITLNGNYDIWQRGSTFTATTNDAYNADRWQSALNYSGGTTNVTRDTSVPNAESMYSLKVTHATANTTTISEYSQRQRVEAENVFPLLGKTVTLSFWYKSSKTGNHGYRLYPVTITGAADTQGTFSVSAANTWEKKTITTSALFGSATAYTGSANAQALWIMLGFQTNGSGQTSVSSTDYFQIAQVQLESGSVATNFLRNGATIQGELAACQRYYQRVDSANASDTRMNTANMVANSTTVAYGNFPFSVRMRTSPTFGSSTATGWSLGRINAALTALGQERSSQYSAMVRATVASGLTAGSGDWLEAGNNNTAYIEFSAEL